MLGSPQFLDNGSTSSPSNNWSNKPNDTLSTPTTSSTFNTNLGDPILFSPTLKQQQQQQQQNNPFIDPQQQQQIAMVKMENSPKSNSMLTNTPGSTTSTRKQQRHTNNGYANASKPFSYAEGYHYLINYVRQK